MFVMQLLEKKDKTPQITRNAFVELTKKEIAATCKKIDKIGSGFSPSVDSTVRTALTYAKTGVRISLPEADLSGKDRERLHAEMENLKNLCKKVGLSLVVDYTTPYTQFTQIKPVKSN